MLTLYHGNLQKIVHILEKRLLAFALKNISGALLLSKQRMLWRWYQRLVMQKNEAVVMVSFG
jgi:hypothetical protein